MHIANELRAGTELAGYLRSGIYREPWEIGDGAPVLLIPGLGAGDSSLGYLASWLRRSGYRPKRAGMLCNIACSERSMEALERRLVESVDEHGPAYIVGHSRGGLFAKALAVRHPERIRGIATLGTPLVGSIRSVNPLLQLQLAGMSRLGAHLPGLVSPGCADPGAWDSPGTNGVQRLLLGSARTQYDCADHCCEPFWLDLARAWPAEVAFLSIHSTQDGIVDARATMDPAAVHRRIGGSHVGMAWSTEVLKALSEWLVETSVAS